MCVAKYTESMTRKRLSDPADRGREGGKVRAARLTPEERRSAARKAALARWRGTTEAQRRKAVGKLVLARWKRARMMSRGHDPQAKKPELPAPGAK